MNRQKSIIVIGKPGSGKSGFFGQLYSRLNYQDGEIKFLKEPENLSVLEPVINAYAESKAVHHTSSSIYEDIEFDLTNGTDEFTIKYPDYGGEQVNNLLHSRKLTKAWNKELVSSDHWVLFIRLADLEVSLDPIQRFSDLVQGKDTRPNNSTIGEKFMSAQSEFIELLQMLMFNKGIGFSQPILRPNLCIVLSCWDKLSMEDQKRLPNTLFKDHLPMLADFVSSNWNLDNYSVIGLSSQGKELSITEADKDWLDLEEGYIIDVDGLKTTDLTQIFKLIPNLLLW